MRWDLSTVELIDGRRGTHLATLLPLDKAKNADGRRRVIPTSNEAPPPPAGIAPRMAEIMAEYAATGLPPAYLPCDRTSNTTPDDDDAANTTTTSTRGAR
jgi:hypothetical protein